MPEILNVRSERCEGCLYRPEALASNRAEGIQYLKKHEDTYFPCHCHDSKAEGGEVLCRGFYDAHPDRLHARGVVRIKRKKGRFWQRFKKLAAGSGVFIGTKKENDDAA